MKTLTLIAVLLLAGCHGPKDGQGVCFFNGSDLEIAHVVKKAPTGFLDKNVGLLRTSSGVVEYRLGETLDLEACGR